MPCPDTSLRYITALYWSVTTMATVGYGDVVAYSVREKVVATVSMLLGASFFAYFMGAMSTVGGQAWGGPAGFSL